MKKILTVSLFAMMAVSAANAEIASTDYVGKQITATAGTLSNLTTTERTNLVGAINELKDGMTTMDDGYGTVIDELSSSFTSYQTSNDAAVAAAKEAGDDAQADLNAYKTSNNAALALKANSEDVYTKTAADAEFMNSSEVSTAIANAVTGDTGALKDYVTNTALADSQSAQDTTLKAYADDAAAAAKSGAESTAAAALDAYKTTNAEAVAAAKKAGDDAQADLDAYKTTNAEAVAAAKKAGDDAQATADTKQAKSTADYQLGNKDGTWTTIKSYYEGLPSYCSTGTCSLVAKEGTIQWEKVSY